MISWMQKHNRYLVWTIWIATITFIGAGFVGWGQYNLGSKATSIGKVGDVELKHTHLSIVYNNLYNQYNQMFQGKLDKETAKKLNIQGQAYEKLASQAKILNLAKEMGIIVSDKELQETFEKIEPFQKEGQFHRPYYDSYLANQRLKAKTFEEMLRDEMTVSKVLKLLNVPTLPLEKKSIEATNAIADKIIYKVLTTSDVEQTLSEEKIRTFWQDNKESYQTKRNYTLTLLWTKVESEVTQEELKEHYEQSAFSYTDGEGKRLPFEKAKEQVQKSLQMKRSKKRAMKDFIALKKGETNGSETITLSQNDAKLPTEVWTEITSKEINTLIKPKIVNDKYVSIKIDNIIQPKIMSFEEAKAVVTKEYKRQTQKENLRRLAQNTLKKLDTNNTITSDFLTQESTDNLEGLDNEETLHFLQKLFTSSQENGMIPLMDKVIVYRIIEQKFDNDSQSGSQNLENGTVERVKQESFEKSLLEKLSKRFQVERY
jgi:peptidyl-prolyl cis-trans isomerase D